jgi:hypothetical protein
MICVAWWTTSSPTDTVNERLRKLRLAVHWQTVFTFVSWDSSAQVPTSHSSSCKWSYGLAGGGRLVSWALSSSHLPSCLTNTALKVLSDDSPSWKVTVAEPSTAATSAVTSRTESTANAIPWTSRCWNMSAKSFSMAARPTVRRPLS